MSTNGRTRSTIGVVVAMLGLVAGLLVAAAPPAAAAGDPPQYYDGSIRYSHVVNCPSLIQGFPYEEAGAGVYVGEYMDPDDSFPHVNDTTYVHIVVYGLGNACSGMRFVPAIDLPPGMQLASNNVYCVNSLTPAGPPPLCTGTQLAAPAYGGDHMLLSGDTQNARTWGLPRGRFWEFIFEVKGTQTITSAEIGAYVKMLDGNDSPVLHPTSFGYVFGAAPQPAIFYDSPSTIAATNYPASVGGAPTAQGLLSSGSVFTNGAPGTVRFQLGTTAANLGERGAFHVNNTGLSWNVYTDWAETGFDPLAHGTTYKWRLVFDPDAAGPDTVGAIQTFTTPTAETCKGQDVTVSIGLGQQPTDGNDVILGTPGVDAINGGLGNDTICAGNGNDSVDGGAGNDVIDGGAGRDNIVGGADSDTIIGGAGVDTASYAGATAVVTVSLSAAGAQNTGGGGTDTISTVENLTGGTKGDRLTGNASANAFDGGAGSDRCDGKAGRDTQTRCETRVSIP